MQFIEVIFPCQNRPITRTYPTRYVYSRNKCEKQAKHSGIENIRSKHIKDRVESTTIVLNFCEFRPCGTSSLFRHFTGRCCEDKSINFLGNIGTNPLLYIGVKPQDVWSSLVTIIIIIHHEIGLERHVPASPKSLFRSLPSRLLPFGLQFQSSVNTNYYIRFTSPHFCNNKYYQLLCTKFEFAFRIMKHIPNPTVSSEGFSISQPPKMCCLHICHNAMTCQ
jgi:hypothetical protein